MRDIYPHHTSSSPLLLVLIGYRVRRCRQISSIGTGVCVCDSDGASSTLRGKVCAAGKDKNKKQKKAERTFIPCLLPWEYCKAHIGNCHMVNNIWINTIHAVYKLFLHRCAASVHPDRRAVSKRCDKASTCCMHRSFPVIPVPHHLLATTCHTEMHWSKAPAVTITWHSCSCFLSSKCLLKNTPTVQSFLPTAYYKSENREYFATPSSYINVLYFGVVYAQKRTSANQSFYIT